MTRASWLHTIPLVTIVVVAMTAPALAQDDAFKAGKQARGRSNPDWKQVEEQMRKAIAADPNDSDRRVGRGITDWAGEPYIPHYYLGEALHRQGQCVEALTNWDVFQKAGAVAKRAELLKVMESGYQECEAKGVLTTAKLGAAIKLADDAIAAANAAAQKVSSYADANAPVWNLDPNLTARTRSAHVELERARTGVATAKTSRLQRDLTEAKRLADSANKTFGDVLADAERRVKNFADVSSGLDRALQAAYAKANDLKAEIDQAAAAPLRLSNADVIDSYTQALQLLNNTQSRVGASRAGAVLEEATRTVREAETILSGASSKLEAFTRDARARLLKDLTDRAPAEFASAKLALDTVTQATRNKLPNEDQRPQIDKDLLSATRTLANAPKLFQAAIEKADVTAALSAFGSAAAVVRRLAKYSELIGGAANPFEAPEAVRSAAQLFFDARYQDAIAALTDELAASSGRHAVHVHTLRAAALFALHEYGGRKDQALLARARADAQAARALDPSFAPNPAAFSPRFITFFQSSGR